MAKARLARHPKPEEIPAEEASQEVPEEEPSFALEHENGQSNISKAEAVRQAMAQGLDDLDAIAAYVKQHHGIEMPRPQLSAYCSQQRARQRKAEGGEPTPRRRSTSPASSFATIPPGFGDDVKQVKELLEQSGGADQLTELVDSVGRLAAKYGPDGLKNLIQAFG